MTRSHANLSVGLASILTLTSILTVASMAGLARAADDANTPAAPSKKLDKDSLEKRFSETLTGATLDGYFTEGPSDAKPHESRYVIDKVVKATGDTWIFTARIVYNGHDLTLPIPLAVLWAGDTPVISLDSVNLPGLGTFSSRVLISDNQFAGTWSGAQHGGNMFGRITHAGKDAKPKEPVKP